MSITQAKEQLISLVGDRELKVVALSGAWGTGKTHLWKEICNESQDAAIRGARYVSLFGVKDINQLKLKVVQSALPVGGESSSLTESFMATWKTSVDALKKVNQGFSALDELALVAVPVALRNRFVAIDDVERKHASLSVDEILGFVDEYSQNFGTRFLLILNSDQFSNPADDGLWTSFRERVVEEEIRFVPTAIEAFDIAVPDPTAPYRVAAREAVDACGLTNIRVIRQSYRLVLRLLGGSPELPPAIQARTVPSIVLISAIHNRAIKDGPTLDYVMGYNRGDSRWLDQYLGGKNATSRSKTEDTTPAAWKVLLSKLGINSADEFEELVVKYLRDGRHESEAIDAIIQGYRTNQNRMDARSEAHAFLERFNWSVTDPDEELLADAGHLVSRAADLDPYTVTALCKEIVDLPNGTSVADRLIDAWLAYFQKIGDKSEFGELPFDQPLDPRLKAAIDGARDARIHSASVVDTIKYLIEHNGWGRSEETAMRSASVDDFETAVRTLKGREFKLFVLKSLDILENDQMYERHFGDAGQNFLTACRRIAKAETGNRFGRLLRTLFAQSKVPSLFADDSIQVDDESAQH